MRKTFKQWQSIYPDALLLQLTGSKPTTVDQALQAMYGQPDQAKLLDHSSKSTGKSGNVKHNCTFVASRLALQESEVASGN